ncbi:recombinase family protein [Stappia stellulata]|uniref:recombinase family protein n=1 Tax=Stappia stellulata TaxID=71235 RepID=UPI001CD72212|nr:recombinase family protein [Stappia stellulata]MCA1241473.1 recombinase family protein [Stappia stellulata]
MKRIFQIKHCLLLLNLGKIFAKTILFATPLVDEQNQTLGRCKILSQNIRMKVGYARVSTIDQNPDAQRNALTTAGCETIVTETASGASEKRPGLAKLMRSLAPGDVLTVWRLDRLGRSLPHLIGRVRDLEDKGAYCPQNSLLRGLVRPDGRNRICSS